MRRTSRTGSFFLVFLFNIMLNFRLTIPGWILLILLFIIPQYIKWWYSLIYFGVFLLYMLIWMLILWGLGAWANSVPPTPRVKNKNPYSVSTNEIPKPIQNKTPTPWEAPRQMNHPHRIKAKENEHEKST